MARSVTIRDISRSRGIWTIQSGKDGFEVPGNIADLRRWARDKVRSIDKDTLAAILLMQHMQTDPQLDNVAAIIGQEFTLTLGGQEVVDG